MFMKHGFNHFLATSYVLLSNPTMMSTLDTVTTMMSTLDTVTTMMSTLDTVTCHTYDDVMFEMVTMRIQISDMSTALGHQRNKATNHGPQHRNRKYHI